MLPAKAQPPWNDWYHVMCHTYGTWLPGDPRGFRTRHHREHVEGDYKSPPLEGRYDARWQRSKNLLKRDPIHLSLSQRRRAVEEFVRSFQKWKVFLRIIAIDSVHLHALLQTHDHNPRRAMGLAKKECSAYMKLDGVAPTGGLWSVRCECRPVAEQTHFDRIVQYIRRHEKNGGAVWEHVAASR